jgi:hypothetical protein
MLYFIYSSYVSKYIFFIYDYLLILNSMRLDKDGGRWDEAEDKEGVGGGPPVRRRRRRSRTMTCTSRWTTQRNRPMSRLSSKTPMWHSRTTMTMLI